MKTLVRPELPTAALRSSQATHAAVDNSAPLPTHPESTYKSGKVVQTNATTSVCHSWFNRFRKLLVRYEKLDRSFLALNHLAAGIIAFRKVNLKINIIYG